MHEKVEKKYRERRVKNEQAILQCPSSHAYSSDNSNDKSEDEKKKSPTFSLLLPIRR